MKEKIEKMDKKKLMIVGGFLLLIVVILFGGAFFYNRYFYKRSYEEIETILKSAAKDYYAKNADELPMEVNQSVTVSESDLVASETMKSISEYLKDETISCDGSVTVTNMNGKYRYVPLLDCGEKHKTLKFSEYIEKNIPIVEEGTMIDGLYQMNNELVYRGENVNNYVKIVKPAAKELSEQLYRIVKITSEGYPVILYDGKLESVVWDNRYNIEKKSSVGINDYSVSKMKEYLEELYASNTLVSEEDKMMFVSHSINVGKRNDDDTDKSGSLEKSAFIEKQMISLLPVYDYLNASLDSNCTSTDSPSCMNYNYLAKYGYNWWTSTASSENTYKVYRISQTASQSSASNNGYVRPVFYLAKDVLYVSGDGTQENPYVLK